MQSRLLSIDSEQCIRGNASEATGATEDRDCEAGELPTCDVYVNACFLCSSAFTASAFCSVAGDPESLCVDVGKKLAGA
jgi:hypothetical protein